MQKNLAVKWYEISALKGTGIKEAAEKAVKLAECQKSDRSLRIEFSDQGRSRSSVAVENRLIGIVPEEQKRFFAIKLLGER